MSKQMLNSSTLEVSLSRMYHLNFMQFTRSTTSHVKFFLSFEEVTGESEVFQVQNKTWIVSDASSKSHLSEADSLCSDSPSDFPVRG
jgi:uncharacterized Fe-S cluster protein YjdI